MSRLIKRYGNRKLYDTQESRYVTLEVIASLVKQGEEVRVLDNDSGEDLTAVTFAQIILEEERRKHGPLAAADSPQDHPARRSDAAGHRHARRSRHRSDRLDWRKGRQARAGAGRVAERLRARRFSTIC